VQNEQPFWKKHKDALLVSIAGTTIGTVLAAAIIFIASSLAGLINVSAAHAGTTLAYVAVGLVVALRGGLIAAEWVLTFQVRRAEALTERAVMNAETRRRNLEHVMVASRRQ
jgi:divalent metal cation (Fe/Co/Zn/Cd) transporter